LSILKVDQIKCIKCGICSMLCPAKVLKISENSPYIKNEQGCIACGHCVSVCPQSALDNENNPLAKQIPLKKFPVLDTQTAEYFLRSRRSVRCYTKKTVSKETILKLLDIARFAPTPSNTQGISFIVVQNPKIMRHITESTINWMEDQYLAGDKTAVNYGYGLYVKLYKRTNKDLILHDAPVLIVAIAPDDFPFRRDNTITSLSYLELYATTFGLGSCRIGFVENCGMCKYPPLLDCLNIPQGEIITGAVVIGYPKYNFNRLVERNPLNVTWINE
jgi:nitroreductase/NAD-dependent dihydropyrimidine dehydrogenase PreA subunit